MDINLAKRSLAMAIRCGWVKHAQSLVRGLSMSGKHELLCQACSAGHYELAVSLLLAGCHPFIGSMTKANKATLPPLVIACGAGHSDIVKAILFNSPFDTPTIKQDVLVSVIGDAIFAAAKNGHHSIVENLLTLGSKMTNRVIPNQTPALAAACGGGHIQAAKILVQTGKADLPRIKWEIVRRACKDGRAEVVHFVLNAGRTQDQATTEDEYVAAIVHLFGTAGAIVDLIQVANEGKSEYLVKLLLKAYVAATRCTSVYAGQESQHIRQVDLLLIAAGVAC